MSGNNRSTSGFLSLVALIAFSATAHSQKRPEAQEGKWIHVPGSVVSYRSVRGRGAPAKQYQCVVAVSPAAQPNLVKPRILRSSGEPGLDELAWEFVKDRITKTPALRSMLPTKELVFQLEMTPPSAETSGYRDFTIEAGLEAATRTTGYFTPRPPYPRHARRFWQEGLGLIKITFSRETGKPLEAIMERSTGSRELDVSSIQWAVLHWRNLQPGTTPQIKFVPIRYELRR